MNDKQNEHYFKKMPFKPKQTYSESDEREQRSIDFINGLLKGTSAYPELKYGEKGANIDGYIQLLDNERCIDGKLTAQVKTVRPSYEGKNAYPCPTSLFAYAERTIDVVFFMAVDHSRNVVLWKYISRTLINDNQDKDDQETITLHFDSSEQLTPDNVSETIEKWKSLFLQKRNLIESAGVIKEENEHLRQQLVLAENPIISIPKSEIVKLQKFSDSYNGLLDKEFKYIKKFRYPYTWKLGLALFIYKDTELLYALYSINYGENSLLIKQLPVDMLASNRFNYACHSSVDNKIKNDIPTLVKEKITDDVTRFFERKKVIPLYDNYIIEYVQDFVRKNYHKLGVSKDIVYNYQALKNAIEQYCAPFGHVPVVAVIDNIRLETGLIYDCLNYLLNRGYNGHIELYPPKGSYGNTGFVSDWYNPEKAYEKLQIIFKYVYTTYTDFINVNFPDIKEHIDMYNGADYVLINLNYDEGPSLMINYIYSTDGNGRMGETVVEFSLDKNHELYKSPDCDPSSNYPFFEREIHYMGRTYECKSCNSLNAHEYLFSNTCLIDTFHDIFKTRLEDYIRGMHIVV